MLTFEEAAMLMINAPKAIKSAERDLSAANKGKVTIVYEDDSTYTLECDRTETSTKITLTNFKETWKEKDEN